MQWVVVHLNSAQAEKQVRGMGSLTILGPRSMGSAAGVFLSKTLTTAGVFVWCVGFKVTASACQAVTRTSIAFQENQKGLMVFIAGLGGSASNAGRGTHAILKQNQRCAQMFGLDCRGRGRAGAKSASHLPAIIPKFAKIPRRR